MLCANGCESLQKKFIRKPKAQARASPIISFQDYTRTMTPLDRYRKHYAIFDYWNAELMNALQDASVNPKRLKHASTESLQELTVLQQMLQDDVVGPVTHLITEREELNRQLQRGLYSPSQLRRMHNTVEQQTRQIHRHLFWRDVEDHLKPSSSEANASPD